MRKPHWNHHRRADRRAAGPVHPAGRQNLNLFVTTIIGVVGALIGWWIAGLIGGQQTGGLDWIRWIISVIVAALGIAAYGALTRRA